MPLTRLARRAMLATVVAATTACAPGHADTPSSPPPGTTTATSTAPSGARAALDTLRVAASGPMTGYSDKQFPHWISQRAAGKGCDTREVVLKRDGRAVTVNTDCSPVSGTWISPYDNETWTKASDVDIDHVVPRGNAWISGAATWTPQQRTEFANDLVRPELIAVTDNLNQQKRDKSPDQWKPPLVSYWCTYATNWITVKAHWHLTITDAEKTALADMLRRCPAPPR
ncbi:HNH endonuclease family protein [Amycolatopsis minnesotensis]|uniref:HNH endonuclease family protein n=1 Tax=Amycolatopsis minnesotensis TaxID=337894 RepID=A0ABN2SAS8_9PSEU